MPTSRNHSRRDALIMDSLTALGLIAVSMLLVGAGSSLISDSLFFEQSTTSLAIWAILPLLPISIRRVLPDRSAQAFLFICAWQLLVGPVLLIADLAAIPILYSVLVYGRKSASHAYTLVAFIMCLLTSLVIAFTQVRDSLFNSASLLPSLRSLLSLFAQSLFFLLPISLTILCTIAVAYWRRARLHQISLMEERNQALERSQQEQERLATLAERARIARDMHDVVAHNLSIIIVQAGGGMYAGAQDAATAVQVMRTIHEETRVSIADMNHLLSDLDDSPDSPVGSAAVEPIGGRCGQTSRYATIETLLHQARAAASSSDIHRTIRGQVRPELLSVQADDAVYRVYQEALSNIRKHAGEGAHVEISEGWSPTRLTLRIVDDGGGQEVDQTAAGAVQTDEADADQTAEASSDGDPADGNRPARDRTDGNDTDGDKDSRQATAGTDRPEPPKVNGSDQSHGFGLIGMRERVDALNGDLAAGPWTDSTGRVGGFSLTVSIPLETPPTESAQSLSTLVGTWLSRRADRPDQTTALDAHGRADDRQGRAHQTVSAEAADRSQPTDSDQTHESKAPRRNIIERISLWTQQRVGLVDSLAALALTALFLYIVWPESHLVILLVETILLCLPIAIRRLRPQLSAALAVSLLILSSFLPQPISPAVFLCAIPLYSVVLYGPHKALRWVSPATVLGLAALTRYAYVNRVSSSTNHSQSTYDVILEVIPITLVLALGCAAIIFWALIKRNRGNNLLLLRAKENALLASRAQAAALVAQFERNRIFQQIHQSVTDTLATVLTTSQGWLSRLEEVESRTAPAAAPSGQDAELIRQAFDDVAGTGRQALAQMRELLGILRSSESEQEKQGIKLTPVSGNSHENR